MLKYLRDSKNGDFTVRSAYYLQKDFERRGMAESSITPTHSKVWSKIWGQKAPNVVKNFLWRACHEILPTKKNLQQRKINEDPLCPVCGLEEETTRHILWECISARDVWCMGRIKFQKSSNNGPDFLAIVEEMFSRCQPEELGLFAVVARRIWLRRNEVVHGGPFQHPSMLMHHATRAAEEFHEVAQTGNQKLGDISKERRGPKMESTISGLSEIKLGRLSKERSGNNGLWHSGAGRERFGGGSTMQVSFGQP